MASYRQIDEADEGDILKSTEFLTRMKVDPSNIIHTSCVNRDGIDVLQARVAETIVSSLSYESAAYAHNAAVVTRERHQQLIEVGLQHLQNFLGSMQWLNDSVFIFQ